MSKTNRTHARQGDVLFIRISGKGPKIGKPIADDNGRIVLATGETSNHVHAVDSSSAKLFELEQAERASDDTQRVYDRMLEVLKPTKSRVEGTTDRANQDYRHPPVELPVGKYVVRIMGEYSPDALRSVAD